MRLAPAIRSMPPPVPVPWRMRDLSTAETEMHRLDDGRLHLGIRHAVLRGITPAMLVWWFQHLEGDVELEGRRWPRYRVWHPIDHVAISYPRRVPDGSIGPGAQIHIQEAFAGNLDHAVDIITTISKLDETGFVHGPWIGGVPVARLEYTFTPVDGGTLSRRRGGAPPRRRRRAVSHGLRGSAALDARTASCALLTGPTPRTATQRRPPSSVSWLQA